MERWKATKTPTLPFRHVRVARVAETLEAVLVSQTPVTLKLYNEETKGFIDKIFDNDADFLEQYKGFTLSQVWTIYLECAQLNSFSNRFVVENA